MFPFGGYFQPSESSRPAWAQPGLSPAERADLHEAWVEIINQIRACEAWYAHVQPAIDRLK